MHAGGCAPACSTPDLVTTRAAPCRPFCGPRYHPYNCMHTRMSMNANYLAHALLSAPRRCRCL